MSSYLASITQNKDNSFSARKNRCINKSYFFYRIERCEYWPQLIESLRFLKFLPEPELGNKNGVSVISSEKLLPLNIISQDGQIVFSCPEISTWNSARGNIKKQKINPLNFPLVECIPLMKMDEKAVTSDDYEKIKYSSYFTKLVKVLNEIDAKILFDFVSNNNVYSAQFKLLFSILNATQPVDIDSGIIQLDILMKVLHQNEYIIPLLPGVQFDNLHYSINTGRKIISKDGNKIVKFCDIFDASFSTQLSMFNNVSSNFHKYSCDCADTSFGKLLSLLPNTSHVEITFIDDIEFMYIKHDDFQYMLGLGNDFMINTPLQFKCIVWFSCEFASVSIKIIIEKMIIF
jgi:hypothetical protein